MTIKTGFTQIPNLPVDTLKHYNFIVNLMKNNDIDYQADHELAVIQLAKSLNLSDLYEQEIMKHGVLVDDGNKLKTNPATVSLASTKGSINSLMSALMLTPKSQGLSVVVPEEEDEDTKTLRELGMFND